MRPSWIIWVGSKFSNKRRQREDRGRDDAAPRQGMLSVTGSWKRYDRNSLFPGISRRTSPGNTSISEFWFLELSGHAYVRSLRPCGDSSATPSFPSQPEGKIGLPRANPRGHRGARCQRRPHAILLHAGLGRARLHHRYPHPQPGS